jgi:hypothetical protein
MPHSLAPRLVVVEHVTDEFVAGGVMPDPVSHG